MLTCHDLGKHLGCYGVQTVQTPHLDALAEGGVRFDRAFSTASGCSPARSALATGRYPHTNGVMGLAHPPFGWSLGLAERHTAQILAAAGYTTHLFGFQHVTAHVDRLGFHHLHGFDRIAGCHEHALGATVSARIADFLHRPQSLGPLYLEVNLEEPHRPYNQGGARPDDELGVFVPEYLPAGQESYEEMASLQGAIHQADKAVGEILASLDDTGLGEDTLIVFTADHGIAMPRAKCTLYDPGIEVALVLRWPAGGFEGGQLIREMVSSVDVLPTVLEAAGLDPPEGVQGRSFLPLLRGEAYMERTAVYAEKTYHSYYDPMRAIRTERFKLIRNFETTFRVEVPGDVQDGPIFRSSVERYHGAQHPLAELYDLHEDPLEQHNLQGDGRFADVEQRLDAALWAWMVETADPLLRGPVPSPSYQHALDSEGRRSVMQASDHQ